MLVFEIVFFINLVVYIFFIAQLIVGFFKVKEFKTIKIEPKNAFSIIIPFRNEEKNISQLLESISKLNYPQHLIEVIAIDDLSIDHSVTIFNAWRFKNKLICATLLNNFRFSNSPKKDAITTAISVIKNSWIVTTDADCVVPKNWLATLDQFIQTNNAQMVASSVVYKTKNNWFNYFQQLDLLSLQGTTIGSFGIKKPFMCNGANFAYTKKLFNEIGGFESNNNISSGDDVFLLQKALKYNSKVVFYLKSTQTIVKTQPETNLKLLFMQRVRWASKTTSYNLMYPKILAVVVLSTNFCLILGFVFFAFDLINSLFFLIFFLSKYVVDFVLLCQSSLFLRNKKYVFLLASSFIHPIFIVIVGFYSFFGSFTWKNRVFER